MVESIMSMCRPRPDGLKVRHKWRLAKGFWYCQNEGRVFRISCVRELLLVKGVKMNGKVGVSIAN